MALIDLFTKKTPVAPQAPIASSPDNPFKDLHRALCLKIREARALALENNSESWIKQREWQREVVRILHKDHGNWLPEVEELELLGDREYEAPTHRTLWPSQVLSRQIRNLEAFAWRLHRQEII